MIAQHDPGTIMQTATSFWASKVLLTAIELDLFSVLDEESMTAAKLGDLLGLHPRGTFDFFDALVAMNFLDREGDGPEGRYKNTPATRAFLDKKSPAYIGGFPEMLNSRLFGFWNDLGTALKTGKAQSEIKHNGRPVFEELYSDGDRLGEFLEAMSSIQTANFEALAEKFDFSQYSSLCDAGGALALLSRVIAARYPNMRFINFDLPKVSPHAQKHIDAAGLSGRIEVVSGDFFKDHLPKADIVTMGNILHDWNLEKKKFLIKKVYDTLPEGGVFITIENLIDDARRENVFGLLLSLNMLIEHGDGFDYTGADFCEWCKEIGFRRFEILRLAGPSSAAVAYK